MPAVKNKNESHKVLPFLWLQLPLQFAVLAPQKLPTRRVLLTGFFWQLVLLHRWFTWSCFVFTGVYISKYADCLHPRPWYHGKSGYIVICKLIKVKCKSVFLLFPFIGHYTVQTVFKETFAPITVVGWGVKSCLSRFLTMGCVRLESKRCSWVEWWPAGQQRVQRTFQIAPLRSEIPHRVTFFPGFLSVLGVWGCNLNVAGITAPFPSPFLPSPPAPAHTIFGEKENSGIF